MSDTILTLHPQGKTGVNISKDKYDVIKTAIFDTLQTQGPMSHTELTNQVNLALGSSFDGSVPWYVTTVKLDLEARGAIERISGTRPEQLQLIAAKSAGTAGLI